MSVNSVCELVSRSSLPALHAVCSERPPNAPACPSAACCTTEALLFSSPKMVSSPGKDDRSRSSTEIPRQLTPLANALPAASLHASDTETPGAPVSEVPGLDCRAAVAAAAVASWIAAAQCLVTTVSTTPVTGSEAQGKRVVECCYKPFKSEEWVESILLSCADPISFKLTTSGYVLISPHKVSKHPSEPSVLPEETASAGVCQYINAAESEGQLPHTEI